MHYEIFKQSFFDVKTQTIERDENSLRDKTFNFDELKTKFEDVDKNSKVELRSEY